MSVIAIVILIYIILILHQVNIIIRATRDEMIRIVDDADALRVAVKNKIHVISSIVSVASGMALFKKFMTIFHETPRKTHPSPSDTPPTQ